MDKQTLFSTIFIKRSNFCDILFASKRSKGIKNSEKCFLKKQQKKKKKKNTTQFILTSIILL